MNASNLTVQDRPTQTFIDEMRLKYPTERETDELLVRKLERRRTETERYRLSSLEELLACANAFLDAHLDEPFEVWEPRWLAGGASKLQMLFDLVRGSGENVRHDLLVVRMDPEESHNATSRAREGELLRALEGVVPVPHVHFVDAKGEWFPQPALIYSNAHGVTKSRSTMSGTVSGLGTAFGPELRALLAPQFVEHLARIHSLDVCNDTFAVMQPPETGTTEAARWQLNRIRRVWEEDGAEQSPLMEVATNWLERNLPELDHVSVVHGDYRSGNFLFDEESGQITAWLDWERGHLGDRHRDLAWTTQAMFGYPDENSNGYLICGLLPENDFFETYTRLSGLIVDSERLQWYSILNCYQVLVTTLGSCYRVVRLGKNHQSALLTALKGEAAMCADRLRLMLEKVL